MKLTGGLLVAAGVIPFAQLACVHAADGDGLPPASHDALTLTRFADEDVIDMGVGNVRSIGAEERGAEQDLVDYLESSSQATGETSLFPSLCNSGDAMRYDGTLGTRKHSKSIFCSVRLLPLLGELMYGAPLRSA